MNPNRKKKMKVKPKVAVALSGGVDSGVAAALVAKAGYQAAGFHMALWSEPATKDQRLTSNFTNKCCSTESLEAARKTAHQLGMPFYIVNFEKQFKKRVVDYFLKEYGLGRTPNPCVMCNRFIKFGDLLAYTRKLGYDYLATGHYARVARGNKQYAIRNTQYAIRKTQYAIRKTQDLGKKTSHVSRITYHLLSAKDKTKDQTYFLYNLTQKQLIQVMFPVGGLTKKEVVAMAKKWHLPVARRPESQEVCFYPESDYRPFLKRNIESKIKPGKVVDVKGNLIGKHSGLPLYTIGQRHGFEITAKSVGRRAKNLIPPFYVIAKDVKKNQLVVGFGKETETKEFWVKDVSWIGNAAKGIEHRAKGKKCRVRIRHQGELLGGKIELKTPARWPEGTPRRWREKVKVILDHPQRGIAPGQAAVFYTKLQRSKVAKFQSRKNSLQLCNSETLKLSDVQVLGGGVIESLIFRAK